MAQSILYYPQINIEDSVWLRNAALYWDEICSIVPYEGYADFSPEILYLRDRGQYKALYPQDIFVLGNPGEFDSAVNRYFGVFLRGSSKRIKSDDWYLRVHNPDIETLIHYNKIPERTRNLFLRNELVNMQEDGWFVMNREFASRYMRLLAEFAIKHCGQDMVLGTDEETRITEMYPRTHRKMDRVAVSLMLDKCLPIPAMDVGFEKILDFKEHRKDELLMLREKIQILEADISSCECVEEAKSLIMRFKESWERELILSEKMFNDDKISFVLGSLRSFIADAGGAAGLLQWAQESGVMNIPKTAMGVAVGASGLVGLGAYYINYKNRTRNNTGNNGFAYIVSANKEGLVRNSRVEIL